MILRIKLWLGAALFFVVTLLAVWTKGKKSAVDKIKQHELESYRDTRERMDEVSKPDNADSAREWLLKRGK
jgi:hypothetical protein